MEKTISDESDAETFTWNRA